MIPDGVKKIHTYIYIERERERKTQEKLNSPSLYL